MEKVERLDTQIILCIFVIIVLVISLIPLFSIAKYNFATDDDLLYGNAVLNARKTDTSIGNTLALASNFVAEARENWQGTFSALFLMALHPGVFSHEAYNLTTFIMIFSLMLSTAFLTYTLLVKVLKASLSNWVTITSLLVLFSVQLSISVREGFFWYTGAVYYTFFHSLFLVLVSLIIRLFISKKSNLMLVNTIISVLLAFIISGGNYATALVCGELLLLALLYAVYSKNKIAIVALITMVVVFSIGMYISISAPGNAVRQVAAENAQYVQSGPIKAIGISFVFGAYFALEWFDLACVGLLFVAILLFGPKLAQTKWKFRYPVLVIAVSVCIFASQFTPPAYAATSPGPVRLRNVAYFVFLLLVLFDALYITGWIIRKRDSDVLREGDAGVHRFKTAKIILHRPFAIILIVSIFLGAAFVQHGIDKMPCVVSVSEMRDGTAEEQAKKRLSILNEDEVIYPCAKRSEILS